MNWRSDKLHAMFLEEHFNLRPSYVMDLDLARGLELGIDRR